MKKITVNTGFGYFVNDQGEIVSKADLPKGQHDCQDDLEYIEVADRAVLDAVNVWQDPELAKEQADQAAIAAAIEELAIDRAKNVNGYTFESIKYKD